MTTTQTTVEIRLRLRESPWTTITGRRKPGAEPIGDESFAVVLGGQSEGTVWLMWANGDVLGQLTGGEHYDGEPGEVQRTLANAERLVRQIDDLIAASQAE